MTDRKLLELAAKAAGQSQTWNEFWRGMYNELPGDCWDSSSYWNPLTNDGDALRLAVKLASIGQHINLFLYQNELAVYGPEGNFLCDYKDDPYAATRRAIVSAAAEIGKELK